MHAYLIVGEASEERVGKIAKKLKSKLIPFALATIADARELANFVKVTRSEKTAILINSIDRATAQAASAFLKNLEEPQDNVSYILTAASISEVLPTIISRCQLITLDKKKVSKNNWNDVSEFIRLTPPAKMLSIGDVKNKDEARDYLERFIRVCHAMLVKTNSKHERVARALSIATKTLSSIKANGNVGLQMTNFIVNLS